MTTVNERNPAEADWQPRTYWGEPSLSPESRMYMATPEYAPQHAHLDASGHLMLDGAATRNAGPLFVRVPDAAKDLSADLIEQARRAREASARRASADAGLPAGTSKSTRRKAEPAKASSKPIASMKRSDVERRGPLNRADFIPLSQKRRIRRQAAHLRGDYLYTDAAGDAEESGFKAEPRVKFRPATAAPFKVSISANARNEITRLVQVADGDHETGGSLLGYVTEGILRITRALPPGPDAEATKTSIRTRQDQAVIDKLITEAPGNLIELGSWHSHPWGEGQPSPIDQQSLVGDRRVMGIANPIELIMRPDHTYGWAKPIPVCWALTDSDDPAYDFDVLTVDIAT